MRGGDAGLGVDGAFPKKTQNFFKRLAQDWDLRGRGVEAIIAGDAGFPSRRDSRDNGRDSSFPQQSGRYSSQG